MIPARVAPLASDPIRLAGLSVLLAAEPKVAVLPAERHDHAEVFVYATGRADHRTLDSLRARPDRLSAPVVLVAGTYFGKNLKDLTACGVVTVLPHEAVGSLGDVVLAARTGRAVSLDPYDVLAGSSTSLSFDSREIEIARLLAEGKTTGSISAELRYSERTVKHQIQNMTTRLGLRNRYQLVASLVRSGVI
ncbi:helix-turn-helix transcriptional regulator [Amycolatopsis sp., V23-08]|uniref:Helix-turn-helix transcriptional regulator n=1 Tax=Amycolatopsis heterodermiae TaxID=3110235 RepID=A0ABU5R7T8_9PSEU|nr:helix-turn-helix transcriptional regulator [Amycolatopsis sp., V23-08]MEA5362303.1 helix-turn-helix transcriptional regulator [Amycolatopsis sp., V23-08]